MPAAKKTAKKATRRGGARPGAGRPPGTGKAKAKPADAKLKKGVQATAEQLIEKGVLLSEIGANQRDPIEFMKDVMASPDVPFHHRMDAAKTVAPYCSPKLTHATSRPGDHANDPASITDEQLADVIAGTIGPTGRKATPAKKKRKA